MTTEAAEFVFKPTIGRKHVLRVSAEQVEFDGASIRLADVEHVACYLSSLSQTAAGLKVGGTSYTAQYWLAGGSGELSVRLSAGPVTSQWERLTAAFTVLDGTVAQLVVPRLVGQAAARVHGGETVTVGGRNVIEAANTYGLAKLAKRAVAPDSVAVGPEGVTLRSGKKARDWSWAQITGAGLSNGEVWLTTGDGNVKLLPLTAVDAYLLPDLISTVQAV